MPSFFMFTVYLHLVKELMKPISTRLLVWK